MRFEPVLAKSGISYEGYAEWEGCLHFLNDDALHLFFLLWEDGEV